MSHKANPISKLLNHMGTVKQILTAHAQPFRGARDLAFCLKVPLDSMLVWASSGGSGETARMRRLAWTFAARIGDKYQIRLTRSISVILPEFRVENHGFVSAQSLFRIAARLAQSGKSLTANQGVAGSSAGPATIFRCDFYDHSHPSADSRRTVVSYWRKTGH